MTRWLLLLALLVAGPAAADDRLVLRDGTVVSGTVQSFDPDGVAVAVVGKEQPVRVGWEEVEVGTVAARQADFDALLAKYGEAVFRVRQRLRTGDFREVLEPAEKVYPDYARRKSPVAYTVCLATVLGRLAHNKPEAAVEPLLACLAVTRAKGFTGDPKLQVAGGRKLTFDEATGLCPQLPPVWFDPAAAKAALPLVEARLKDWAGAPPGVSVYAATLALTAGDAAAARHRAAIDQVKLLADWPAVLDTHAEVAAGGAAPKAAALADRIEKLLPSVRPAAAYWAGLGLLKSPEAAAQKRGVLCLLTVAARAGDTAPELAAAGLFHAARGMDALNDARGAVVVRGELVANFRQTAHAVKLSGPPAAKETDRP